jgi:hypothetical protein
MLSKYVKQFLFLIVVLIFCGCQSSNISETNFLYYNQQPESEETLDQTQETSEKIDIRPEYYPYDAGYTGIEEEQVPHEYGNTPFANINFGYMDRNICYVQEIDTLYYVDYAPVDDEYGDPDNCLYSYKDGVRTMITNLPARYLSYWRGNLYFLVNSDVNVFYSILGNAACGKLYRYDIITGEVNLLLDEDIFDLNICDGYLYYRTAPVHGEKVVIKNDPTAPGYEAVELLSTGDYCRLNLDNGISEKTYLLPYFHGEYQLQISPDSTNISLAALELTNGTETVRLLDYGLYRTSANYCIAEGKLWFVHNDEEKNRAFSSMDLTTGEVITYQLSNINSNVRDDFLWDEASITVGSVVLLNGVLYADLNSNLFFYDTELEEMIPVEGEFDVSIGTVFWGIRNLYTDGAYIYGYNDIRDIIVKFRKLDDGMYTGEIIPRS